MPLPHINLRGHNEAFDALEARYADFRKLKFPIECARVINGVGLALLTMQTETNLERFFGSQADPRSVEELPQLIERFDQALPGLPCPAQAYFAALRNLSAEAMTFVRENRDLRHPDIRGHWCTRSL